MSEGGGRYKEWLKISSPSIVEAFSKYKSISMSLDIFLETAPLMTPRLYSISSSYSDSPDAISIVVSVVSYYSQSQETRHGICSTFLTQSSPNTLVRCWVESNPSFKLPLDGSPLIMITAGIGLAPFKSFWEHRLSEISNGNGNQIGPAIVVLGCRDPDNQLFVQQTEQAIQNNALTSVFTAYSR